MPIFPGVMIIEAMAQTSGILVGLTMDLVDKNANVFFMGVDAVKFRRKVVPGDVLELQEGRLLVRFADPETQLKAADILKDQLGREYIVALKLASAAPGFMRALGLNPMYLGLDLRGGCLLYTSRCV